MNKKLTINRKYLIIDILYSILSLVFFILFTHMIITAIAQAKIHMPTQQVPLALKRISTVTAIVIIIGATC